MDIDFTYDALTQAFFGCEAKLGNDIFYFGGVGADSNQVIIILTIRTLMYCPVFYVSI